jgi:hypothetical protein
MIPRLTRPAILFLPVAGSAQEPKAGDEALGTRKYSEYDKPQFCGTSCHVDFYQQWVQVMMSQCYIHHCSTITL